MKYTDDGKARPSGPLDTRRIGLPNGRQMVVVRETTFQRAVKAGEDSLQQSRLSPDKFRK